MPVIKKLLFLTVLLPSFCLAQKFDLNISAGVCPFVFSNLQPGGWWIVTADNTYYLSGQTRRSTAFYANASLSYTASKFFNFGADYSYNNAVVHTNGIGIFADVKVLRGRNTLAVGPSLDYQFYSSHYALSYKGNAQTKEYFDGSFAYGLRISDKLRLSKHFSLSAMINPKMTKVVTNFFFYSNGYTLASSAGHLTYHMLYIPFTIGLSYRF